MMSVFELNVICAVCSCTVLDAAAVVMNITDNAMTNRPREIKVGVTAENQFPYLLTIDQVC